MFRTKIFIVVFVVCTLVFVSDVDVNILKVFDHLTFVRDVDV